MALRLVRPLDGADGYPRWKDSMLLVLNSAGVAHVLTKDPPPPPTPASGVDDDGAGARARQQQWECEDAVCRGLILRALSDRLLPDYARHATGAAAWLALARTYDVAASAVAWRGFLDLEIDDDAPLPKQVAHAEALGVAGHGTLDDGVVADTLWQKLPRDVHDRVGAWSDVDNVTMEAIWGVVRVKEEARLRMEAGVVARADMPSPEDQE